MALARSAGPLGTVGLSAQLSRCLKTATFSSSSEPNSCLKFLKELLTGPVGAYSRSIVKDRVAPGRLDRAVCSTHVQIYKRNILELSGP